MAIRPMTVRRPTTLAPGWLDPLSHLTPLRCPADAVRGSYIGEYAKVTTLHGVLVAVSFAALAVTVGTRAVHGAGA